MQSTFQLLQGYKTHLSHLLTQNRCTFEGIKEPVWPHINQFVLRGQLGGWKTCSTNSVIPETKLRMESFTCRNVHLGWAQLEEAQDMGLLGCYGVTCNLDPQGGWTYCLRHHHHHDHKRSHHHHPTKLTVIITNMMTKDSSSNKFSSVMGSRQLTPKQIGQFKNI